MDDYEKLVTELYDKQKKKCFSAVGQEHIGFVIRKMLENSNKMYIYGNPVRDFGIEVVDYMNSMIKKDGKLKLIFYPDAKKNLEKFISENSNEIELAEERPDKEKDISCCAFSPYSWLLCINLHNDKREIIEKIYTASFNSKKTYDNIIKKFGEEVPKHSFRNQLKEIFADILI